MNQANREPPRAGMGFTLIEMLAVITIIGIFAGLIGFALRGSGSTTAGTQAAQSSIAGLLTFARGQAAINGRNAAVLVNNNSSSSDRYLRYIVPVLRNEANSAWEPLSAGIFLPAGNYIVSNVVPAGSAIETGADWSGLNSSALGTSATQAINSGTSENWIGVNFTPRGTTGDQGRLVVAHGRIQPLGSSPPFVFVDPDNVRGVSVTLYGLTRVVNDRKGF